MAVGGGLGIFGIILMLILTGGDIGKVFNMVVQQQGQAPAGGGGAAAAPNNPQHDEWANMIGVVLADTEDVWSKVLPQLPGQLAREYEKPELVLFTGSVKSGCGFAAAQMGPFYCPADRKGLHRPRLLR